MNIDWNIADRALDKAGEEPLTDNDKANKGTRWRLIHDYYLATILETLAGTAWTSQTKRIALKQSEEENISAYFVMYELPLDCAKPVALLSEESYLVEGKNLYTDDPDAVLIYVSNGYTGKYKYEKAEEQPSSENFSKKIYYILNDEGEYKEAEEYEEGVIYYLRIEEDYPLYDDFYPDPLLSEYIETRLASKIVLKITGKTNLYQLLYSEAKLMEDRAVKASFAHGHNKDKGNKYWGEIIGLPEYEDM